MIAWYCESAFLAPVNICGTTRSKEVKMLRDAIYEVIDAVLCDIRDIDKHICPARLLKMPNRESLGELGDAAGHFGDNGNDPDGDAWLAPADCFSQEELAAAERAGGKVIDGYSFPYPRGVVISPNLPRIVAPGEVAVGGWCAYAILGVGYALKRGIAIAVYAASIALAKEEEEEENQD